MDSLLSLLSLLFLLDEFVILSLCKAGDGEQEHKDTSLYPRKLVRKRFVYIQPRRCHSPPGCM